MQATKNRLTALEAKQKHKNWKPPILIYQEFDGDYTTAEGKVLIQEGEKLFFEDGTLFFEPTENPDYVELIRVNYS